MACMAYHYLNTPKPPRTPTFTAAAKKKTTGIKAYDIQSKGFNNQCNKISQKNRTLTVKLLTMILKKSSLELALSKENDRCQLKSNSLNVHQKQFVTEPKKPLRAAINKQAFNDFSNVTLLV